MIHIIVRMAAECKICRSKLASNKLLKEHVKNHSRTIRCSICFLRFPSIKNLNQHYIKRHSKPRIIRQLMNYSLRHSTHSLNWMKTRKKKISPKKYYVENSVKTEKLYVKENIHITYGNKEIFLEISSDNEESLEFSIEDIPNKTFSKKSTKCVNKKKDPLQAFIYDDNANYILEEVKSNEKLVILPQKIKRNKSRKVVRKGNNQVKRYKHFYLEFVKSDYPKSLDHKTGEFYVCNCFKNSLKAEKEDEIITVTSDTESSSDNGKYSFFPIIDKKLYCTVCGNGYRTKSKLLEHRKIHNFYCHTCDTYYGSQRHYTAHIKNHVPVYCCHICNNEFLLKLSLKNHLSFHQEQDVLKNVLELEQNYSHYLINFTSENYTNSINKITSFLSQNYEYKYTNHLYKIRCHLCYMEIFKCDFEQHLKFHYYFKNNGAFFPSAIEYSVIA